MTMRSEAHNDPGATCRIATRYRYEGRIAIRLQSGESREAWARDISESGMGAFVAHALAPHETVVLTFRLSDSVRLTLPAEVVKVDGTRYGFRFTALSAQQRADIQAAFKGHPEAELKSVPRNSPTTTRRSALSVTESHYTSITGLSLSDRARDLIRHGYTPKVAVELALQEVEIEHGPASSAAEKARADADDFLQKLRRGLI